MQEVPVTLGLVYNGLPLICVSELPNDMTRSFLSRTNVKDCQPGSASKNWLALDVSEVPNESSRNTIKIFVQPIIG